MLHDTTLSRLADLAADQWGLVTRRQVERAGIAPRTLDRLSSKDSLLERVAHGVYRLTTAPIPDHMTLRAAWLQLAPDIPAWERTPSHGVVSHRSAARLYGLGDLPADRHEFTVVGRKQSRRADVRLHVRSLTQDEWVAVGGMPVTRPSRIASDLLFEREDPSAVARIVADALRSILDYPGYFGKALAPHAARFGLRRGDGVGMLGWLLDLVDDPEKARWLQEARMSGATGDEGESNGRDHAGSESTRRR